MKSERKLTPIQKVIEKFILEEYKVGRSFWAKESKFARQLIQKYSFDFLEWVPVPFGYKIQSLIFFLTQDGKGYLASQYFEYLKLKIKNPTKEEIILHNEPLGDNINITKKPTNLQEFIQK
jgi:hypothetical protein